MRQPRYRSYFCLLASMATAYALLPNPQDPLMQPISPQLTPPRRTVIRTTSNSISGFYPLYDLLSITTQSGSISVHVSPHAASSNAPSQPATLEIRSASGSVHATLSEAIVNHHTGADSATDLPPPPYSSVVDDDCLKSSAEARSKDTAEQHREGRSSNAVTQSGFPARNYITSVTTASGSISGMFPLGMRTALESHSGSLSNVDLVVMPANVSESRRLSTIGRSGSQSVRIVEDGFWAREEQGSWWEGMVSRHESQSGSISLEYPDSWEGMIDVETASGSVSVTGRGVQIVRKENGRLVAYKGEATGAKVFIKAASGKVDLSFG